MSARIEYSGVDYFTATAARSGQGEKLYPIARMIAQQLEANMSQKQWKFFGYHGWIYSDPLVGHFAYGSASDDRMGEILQASGEIANYYFPNVLFQRNDVPLRWTRIDLCADVTLGQQRECVCADGYKRLIALKTKNKVSLVTNNLGGETLYIGSRSSDQFGRVYDKGVEKGSLAPGWQYRYEIELKGKRAKVASNQLASLAAPTTWSQGIATTIYDWFDERNVSPVFTRGDLYGLDLRVKWEAPNDEQKLLWLRTQVGPTVKKLFLRASTETLEALGIADFVTSKCAH